jgi:hypothetical protein
LIAGNGRQLPDVILATARMDAERSSVAAAQICAARSHGDGSLDEVLMLVNRS